LSALEPERDVLPTQSWGFTPGVPGVTDDMKRSLPAQCQIALKEWASVLVALERGEQLVLIRKGGLIEPGSGFELVSDVFLFYPTFEHQTVSFLRSPYTHYLEEAHRRKASEGQVRVELCGHVVSSTRHTDPAVMERLRSFHVYNDAFATQRLKWQPDQPLVVAVVRAFRLATPQVLSVASRYAGCKSWVDLEQPVSLQGAESVLEDSVFADRLSQIQDLLGETAS